MAYTNSNVPTLMDIANISKTDYKIDRVIEILNETNDIMKLMAWMEGNTPTGHETKVRTGLPLPTWRKQYGFVKATKSITAQVIEPMGMLEAISEVDAAMPVAGNIAEFRMSEDAAHIEAMGQEFVDTFFYGADDPDAFLGLEPRYNLINGADNSKNVFDGKGSLGGADASASDKLNSVWLLVMSPNTITGLTPRGMGSGIVVDDRGLQVIQGMADTNTDAEATPGRMKAYITHFKMYSGLNVADWRYGVRIANIPVEREIHNIITGVNPPFTTLPELMRNAIRRVPNINAGNAMFCMSADTQLLLGQMISRLTSESSLGAEDVGGTMFDTFRGVPVVRVDQLARDETFLGSTGA